MRKSNKTGTEHSKSFDSIRGTGWGINTNAVLEWSGNGRCDDVEKNCKFNYWILFLVSFPFLPSSCFQFIFYSQSKSLVFPCLRLQWTRWFSKPSPHWNFIKRHRFEHGTLLAEFQTWLSIESFRRKIQLIWAICDFNVPCFS